MPSDQERLGRSLRVIERAAADLPWAGERRWTTASHLCNDRGVPLLDLHDLNVKLGREAVRLASSAIHDAGAIHFVTGRGRHAINRTSVLRQVVAEELEQLCQQHGWSYHPAGPGRFTLVLDADRAPAAAGRLGWGCWLGAAAFGAALIYAIPPAAVLVPAVALGLWLATRHTRQAERRNRQDGGGEPPDGASPS